MQILVIDDDRGTRFVLRTVLTRHFNCTVVEAQDGEEALDLLETGSFDLILLDLHMPVRSGLDVLREIRASTECRDVPVIMLTADRGQAAVEEAIALGIQGYLTKPLNIERVMERLSRLQVTPARS